MKGSVGHSRAQRRIRQHPPHPFKDYEPCKPWRIYKDLVQKGTERMLRLARVGRSVCARACELLCLFPSACLADFFPRFSRVVDSKIEQFIDCLLHKTNVLRPTRTSYSLLEQKSATKRANKHLPCLLLYLRLLRIYIVVHPVQVSGLGGNNCGTPSSQCCSCSPHRRETVPGGHIDRCIALPALPCLYPPSTQVVTEQCLLYLCFLILLDHRSREVLESLHPLLNRTIVFDCFRALV